MNRLKTNKATTKRFKITKNKKVLFRPSHQNHYNADSTGDETRKKRKIKNVGGALKRRIISKSRT